MHSAPVLLHYRKCGSASYIVREVLLVRERERYREREIDGSDVTIVALKLAMNLHFPLPKSRTIGDELTLSLAKNSHFSILPSHFPSLPSRRGHHGGAEIRNEFTLKLSIAKTFFALRLCSPSFKWHEPRDAWSKTQDKWSNLAQSYFALPIEKLNQINIIGSAEALPILCVRYYWWERERKRYREREIDGSDVAIVALKLAMNLHFPLPKSRTIGDELTLSLAKNSHFSILPSHFPSLPSRRGHHGGAEIRNEFTLKLSIAKTFFALRLSSPSFKWHEPRDAWSKTQDKWSNLAQSYFALPIEKLNQINIIGSAEALPILCVRYYWWERERKRYREREIDGSDVAIVALKLAMNLHFPLPKSRTIGDELTLSLAKNSHFSILPSHFPSLPSRRGHHGGAEIRNEFTLKLSIAKTFFALRLSSPSFKWHEPRDAWSKTQDKWSNLAQSYFALPIEKLNQINIIGSAEALPILCVRYYWWERERERDTEKER